ncbi:hypothetical protein PJK55_14635 [Exiguobacterium sp. MMG028]|uniref:hypothetical protein n=1 Tax=Exiguobacterium sp. MMG028 TaxID=3021979 RepID=UPI0022FE65E4|nr:hypothetical protein [Exiguobacterium sp. MMG028]MDA5561973.1 hypothetical protein [Exiguobacterium sp. MMG028]
MNDYTKKLEAENAGLHMMLDKVYDELGQIRRSREQARRIIRNAIIITEQSHIGPKTKEKLLNELLEVLDT